MLRLKYLYTFFIIFILICLVPLMCKARVNYEKIINPYAKSGEILIKLKNNTKIYKFSNLSNIGIASSVKKWINSDLVDYVEPNYIYRSALLPNDPYFSSQWALTKIKAPEVWDIETGEPIVTVAILDSGVDLDHPDLVNNIWKNEDEIPGNGIDDDNNGYIDDYYGWNFIDKNNDPNPQFSGSWTLEAINHGTAIAGVALANGNNNQGIAGVNWSSKIMAIRVLDSQGVGDTLSVAQGIDYAVANGANVINLSFVGDSNSQTLTDAINRAHDAGVIVVAAAGNEGIDLNQTPRYPVCNENVIGVAATDKSDQKASFSNYGSKCIDISAPGIDIFTALVYEPAQSLNEYYGGGWYGTSVAAPYVVGTISLIKSYHADLSNNEIIETLLINSDKIDNINQNYINQLGYGRLNIYQCLAGPPVEIIIPKDIIVSPGAGKEPQVKIVDREGIELSSFYAYAKNFEGGVKITGGDINGDKIDEIITGPGPGGGPQVRIFKQDGQVINSFFVYDSKFHGGINVAAGDINGDKIDEIITGPGPGGSPQVRIFDHDGKLINSFFAYGVNFKGGVSVATGDLDNDGSEEIITGPGPGGGPQVRIFDKNGKAKFNPGFFAYASTFRNGVSVATGDLDGDGTLEIITGAGPGGGPQVRIFDKNGKAKFNPGFFAYDKNFRGGVSVSAGDIDADNKDEVITGAGPGGGPHVRILDLNGNKKYQFFAFEKSFHGGIFVNSIY